MIEDRPYQAEVIAKFNAAVARYGHALPDDDAGRDDAFVMAAHLARRPDAEHRITKWLSLCCPWMGEDETRELMARACSKQWRWTADKLAIRLRLTEAERRWLGITTIGAIDLTKEERARRRQDRTNQQKELTHRSKGAKSRTDYETNSATRTKPWELLGMSRRSWYRAGKPAP
jgi:hypothetical protein